MEATKAQELMFHTMPGDEILNGRALVIASKVAGAEDVRVVLCLRSNEYQPYVTWKAFIGDEGKVVCENGSYHTTIEAAVADYAARS